MLFFCGKFSLKVQLDLGFVHPGQQLKNCQFLRPEFSDGDSCFTADKDFSVKSLRPFRMETD